MCQCNEFFFRASVANRMQLISFNKFKVLNQTASTFYVLFHFDHNKVHLHLYQQQKLLKRC